MTEQDMAQEFMDVFNKTTSHVLFSILVRDSKYLRNVANILIKYADQIEKE